MYHFCPFTFNLFESLNLQCVSCKQHIVGSRYFIHSASLYLLTRLFNLFTFNVITTKLKFMSSRYLSFIHLISLFLYFSMTIYFFVDVFYYTISLLLFLLYFLQYFATSDLYQISVTYRNFIPVQFCSLLPFCAVTKHKSVFLQLPLYRSACLFQAVRGEECRLGADRCTLRTWCSGPRPGFLWSRVAPACYVLPAASSVLLVLTVPHFCML